MTRYQGKQWWGRGPWGPGKAEGSGLLKPAQLWPLMSPLSGASILPVSLRCLISIFTPPRLFNRVSVIELNLSIVQGIHRTSDWLPTLSHVFWLAEDDPAVSLSVSVVSVGSVIPLYNWSISVCFVPLWPLPLWRDDSLSYDMIPHRWVVTERGHRSHKDKGWRIFHSAIVKVGGRIIPDCRGVSITGYTGLRDTFLISWHWHWLKVTPGGHQALGGRGSLSVLDLHLSRCPGCLVSGSQLTLLCPRQ